jgi:poly(A) polymerase/tRNA nucleotidyltransferase (CCA-adding enzyme)
MLEILPKAVATGAKFGTVTALVREMDGHPTYEVEITTFRSDEKYVGGRWPSEVEFVRNIDEDLKRRDFTWNAMALDLSQIDLDGDAEPKKAKIYDPFDGIQDLDDKLVRAVGDPVERFKEDGLRAYKACRMAAVLEFEIEDETFEAIEKTLSVADQVSMERIRDEFMKIMKGSDKPSVGIEYMRESGLLRLFLPELLEAVDVEQKLYHTHNVYYHLLRTCDVAPKDIRLAALFHDIGKPRKQMPNGHFYGHDLESEEMTKKIMKRMKFSNAQIKKTANLVRNHMFYYPVIDEDATQEEREQYEARKWSDAAVRRFIARVGEDNIDDLFALRIADATANPDGMFQPEEIEQLQRRISEVRQKDMALKVTDLKIDGNDLQNIGVEPGPKMGEILDKLLDEVIEDPSLNERSTLTNMAKGMLE